MLPHVTFVLLLVTCLAGCGGGREPQPRFQSLVVVMIDTLRSDHMTSYGYERDTAPFLAQLAAEGIQLQGYSASSWTRPSVATLLTGLHPQRHQAISRSDHLPRDLAYLPEILSRAGFATAAFVGNRVVGQRWGFARGFGAFGENEQKGKVDGERVTARALALARGLEPPYCLYVHYVDPHDPYVPARPWTEPGERPRPYADVAPLAAGEPAPDAQTLARLVDQYDGEIREVDAAVERLIRGLERQGLLEGTLVVVTADHGEEFGEHGDVLHGRSLFEEVVAVPFLLWSADGLPRRRSSEPFHQVDFVPTALDALGLPAPPEALDGVSRWDAIVSGAPLDDAPQLYHLDLAGAGALAVRRGARKLIHRVDEPHTLVYDLADDPSEQRPLTDDAAAAALLAELLQHHNRLGTLSASRSVAPLDAERRESLAGLGYAGDDTTEEDLAGRAVPRTLDPARGLAQE